MGKAIYTKEDLVSYTGVRFRTIRWWVESGVIPRSYPMGADPVCWGQEHLEAIIRARDIRDQRITLTDLAIRYGYKEVDDGFIPDTDEEQEDADTLLPLDQAVSLDELEESIPELDENDEVIGDWDDTRVHPKWLRG